VLRCVGYVYTKFQVDFKVKRDEDRRTGGAYRDDCVRDPLL
jgi:hypothetical protein